MMADSSAAFVSVAGETFKIEATNVNECLPLYTIHIL